MKIPVHMSLMLKWQAGAMFMCVSVGLLFAAGCNGCNNLPCVQTQIMDRPVPLFVNTRGWQQFYDIEAPCASGEQMLGGGYAFSVEPGQPLFAVIENYPKSSDTWSVRIWNPDPQPPPNKPYVGPN